MQTSQLWQSQICRRTVVDGWAGAVMKKPLAIQKCDQWTVYSCMSATKKACLRFKTTEKKSILRIFFLVFWAKLPLPKCLWEPLNPFSCIPATTLQGDSHRKLNLALLPAINQLKKMHHKKKRAGEGGGGWTRPQFFFLYGPKTW